MYLLDTSICVGVIRRRSARALQRLLACASGEVGVSSITLAELELGTQRSRDPLKNQRALVQFLNPLVIHPFDESAARAYGEVRHRLEREGQPIGALDTLIAAHAVALGHVMVTANVREFERVDGLLVENWDSEPA